MRDELFVRLENETENEFIARIYRHKTELGMNNKQIADKLNEILGTTYGESTLRGRGQYFNEGYSIGYEKALNDKEDNNLLDELEAKRIELEKEKIKYKDQKREYMNFIRQEARWDNLRDCILEEIANINNEKPLSRLVDFEITDGNKACLLLSDLHIGSLIDTYVNKYNMKIAKDRLDELAVKVVSYCRINDVDEINLEILGDIISGNIHISTRLYNEENVIQQTIKASEMLSDFISYIANNIPKVNIYYSVGNHGRCSANYKEHIDEENYEYLIRWYLEGRLKDVDNVEFKDNLFDDEIALIDVFDKKIASVHGHKDKVGKVLDRIRNFTKIMIDEIHMGHYHAFSVQNDVLINGSLSGVDKYAQSLRFNNVPSQVLKIYYRNGDECINDIKLK